MFEGFDRYQFGVVFTEECEEPKLKTSFVMIN